MIKALRLIYRWVNKLIELICILILLFLVVITSQQVLMRFIFNRPASWGEELSIILLIWFGYLGIIIGLRDDKHISISFLVNKFPEKVKKLVDILGRLLIAWFSLLMFQHGLQIVKLDAIREMPATGIPASYVSFALVITGLLILIESVLKIFIPTTDTLRK
ncbi:hypothetical protein HWHPT5561_06895 [Petrotoga sp. HWH.PT.55.6.1]|uniref:TRAP transporter small permease n=1 Tax=unclassified Petrotoga TaxID=2620614 RepID=UPI000CA009D2|nr:MULTISPECIES: TRAP transporter small permease [unclassified Petrotoga]PNR94125.1 hypothetical protein X926_01090 [Petrotoga sp. HWHPT.55.6.3]RPD35543.1 hypothetical protein HWHPT5561_06895 [Petrotoga sp. HWH.PT.55.6.1]